jgi:hypothetical protein
MAEGAGIGRNSVVRIDAAVGCNASWGSASVDAHRCAGVVVADRDSCLVWNALPACHCLRQQHHCYRRRRQKCCQTTRSGSVAASPGLNGCCCCCCCTFGCCCVNLGVVLDPVRLQPMLRLVQPSMQVVDRVLGLAATMVAHRRRVCLGSCCAHATVAADSVRRCRRRRISLTCDCCPCRHGFHGRHARLGRLGRLDRLCRHGPRVRLDCGHRRLCLLSAAVAVVPAASAAAVADADAFWVLSLCRPPRVTDEQRQHEAANVLVRSTSCLVEHLLWGRCRVLGMSGRGCGCLLACPHLDGDGNAKSPSR